MLGPWSHGGMTVGWIASALFLVGGTASWAVGGRADGDVGVPGGGWRRMKDEG